ncbi:VOC family protein [Sphingosinicella sp. LHD-64]|uniref:VOC family protein n=1 Tax=Sphingosinicella sp. LHD-64 TaxID=3072139 RepID=UPI00280C6341|nr:VOC family protein [Sphingosinicella sp. LHD-64]MDQ8755735.1 VOC family protein [Sphingosinicella sp. LHD-64]
MPLTPSHIAQVAIPVRDTDRARTFYRDTLGLAHLFDAPPGLAFFQCGQTRLMLSPPEGPETAAASILYYAVPDARAAEAELTAAGVTFEQGAHFIARVADRDIWLAICRDSEGNLVGLMSEQESV